MKAAVLKSFGSQLVIEDVAEPQLGTGEVIVEVVAAPVLSYAGEVFSGSREYMLTEANEAVTNAAANAGPFKLTVLRAVA